MSKLAAIVPAFNEAPDIGRVVRGLRDLEARPEVFVVDDGSRDATAREAREAGATVLRLPFNCGIGAAVQTGLLATLAGHFDRIVRLDGDAQHDPADLARMLEALDAGANFVLGSRHLEHEGFQTTRSRRLGIQWFTLLIQALCGLRVTDPTSGFWAADRTAAEVLAAQTASDYPEVDSLIQLWRAELEIHEVPVRMHPRTAGHSSIAGLRSLYYMLKVTVALIAVRLGPRRLR